MKNQDDIGVVFVNNVIGYGTMNGVINISFSTFNFSPSDNGEIADDPVVSCRLRMDNACLEQLHLITGKLLEGMRQNAVPSAIAEEDETPVKRSAKDRVKVN